jgi:hypothetical protein
VIRKAVIVFGAETACTEDTGAFIPESIEQALGGIMYQLKNVLEESQSNGMAVGHFNCTQMNAGTYQDFVCVNYLPCFPTRSPFSQNS